MTAWLLRRALAAFQWYRSFGFWDIGKGRERLQDDECAFAIPPPKLRMLVAGTPNEDVFLELGQKAILSIQAALLAAGTDIRNCRSVLDFGCGCGRVKRFRLTA